MSHMDQMLSPLPGLAGRELEEDRDTPAAKAPGRVTLTSKMPASAASIARAVSVQLRRGEGGPGPVPGAPAAAAMAIQEVASAGVSGGGGPLPFLDEIQRLFGHHDVSAVRAHVGGRAAGAAAEIGARAYATGDDVAFAAAPDLHLVAHEAAHVVQQRGGVQLSGGVGAAGDSYEQHADAVADAVVRGDSVEALLDMFAGGSSRGGGGGGVQRAVQRFETMDGHVGQPQPQSQQGQGQQGQNRGQQPRSSLAQSFTFNFPERNLAPRPIPVRGGYMTIMPKLGGDVTVTLQTAEAQNGGAAVENNVSIDAQGRLAHQHTVERELNSRILGCTPTVFGDIQVDGDEASIGVGGTVEMPDQSAVLRSVDARIALLSWDRSPGGEGLSFVQAELQANFGFPPFEMPLGRGQASIAAELHVILELQPDWRQIAQAILRQVATRAAPSVAASGGEAAGAAALTGGLAAPALAAALGIAAGVAVAAMVYAELDNADELERIGRASPGWLYNYCIAYTSEFFGASAGSGGFAREGHNAGRSAVRRIAQQEHCTAEQVLAAARELGARDIYGAIYQRAMPRFRDHYADQIGSRVRFADDLEGALRRAAWGNDAFNREGGPQGLPTYGVAPNPPGATR